MYLECLLQLHRSWPELRVLCRLQALAPEVCAHLPVCCDDALAELQMPFFRSTVGLGGHAVPSS